MKKLLMALSITFFASSFLMFFYLFQNIPIALIDKLYDLSMFTPFFMNFISMIFASFGAKGMTRKTIIYLNILVLFVFGIFYLFALVGFQEP